MQVPRKPVLMTGTNACEFPAAQCSHSLVTSSFSKNVDVGSSVLSSRMNAPRIGVPMFSVEETGGLQLMAGIPVVAMPREGKRVWGSKAVSDSTHREAEKLLLEARTNSSQDLSLIRSFDRWRINYMVDGSMGVILCIFCAYLFEAGLKASTCAAYTRRMLGLCMRQLTGYGHEYHSTHDAIKAMELRAAMEVPEHAVDVSEERANEILSTVRDENARFTIWMMCMCGARVADLQRLTSSQFTIIYGSGEGTNKLKVSFYVTKTGRTQSERRTVTFPIWIPYETQWGQFRGQERHFVLDADALNKKLHAAGYKEETSYSFRRLFINRIIDVFTDDDGYTDWAKVIEMTGHQQAKNVKGHYQVHLEPVKPEGPERKVKKVKL